MKKVFIYGKINELTATERSFALKSIDHIYENLKIVQDDEHLKYGTDALLLSAFVRGTGKQKAVDLGCGTGVIALALAYLGKAKNTVGIEIQESSAALANESVHINGYSDRVQIIHGDFTAMPSEYFGSFDYAAANPPYMKTESGKANLTDTMNIARHEVGCDVYSLCKAASKLVKFGGYFYTVYRPDRISDLFDALRSNKFEIKRLTFVCARPDLAPCLVLTEAKLGAAAGTNVTPVFFISDEEKMKKIYNGGSL